MSDNRVLQDLFTLVRQRNSDAFVRAQDELTLFGALASVAKDFNLDQPRINEPIAKACIRMLHEIRHQAEKKHEHSNPV